MTCMDWNERYRLYAAANGCGPEQMLKADDNRWVGGKMTGFMLWMHEQRAQFLASHASDFDSWLRSQVPMCGVCGEPAVAVTDGPRCDKCLVVPVSAEGAVA